MSSIHNPNYIQTTYKKTTTTYPKDFCEFVFKDFEKGSSILDVGCGNGDFTLAMQNVGLDAYGIDIGTYAENRLEPGKFFQADLQKDNLPCMDDTFDIVFSKSVVEHLHDPSHFMNELFRVLKPGGTIITMTPSWKHSFQEQFYIDHTHVTPFIRHSLATLHELHGFVEIDSDYFYQLPFTWKWPSILTKIFCKTIQVFKIPYRPYEKVSWSDKTNKVIRFSQEAMLFCKAKKPTT